MKQEYKCIKASRRINPFGLRIPEDLKSALKDKTEYSGRSMNAEILFRLRESLNTENTA